MDMKSNLSRENYNLRKKLENLAPIAKAYREHNSLIKLMRKTRATLETNWKLDVGKNRNKMTAKLSYLAGLIDGEGYIKFEENGTIRLIIGMTDKKTITWIYNMFGGSINIDQKTKKGLNFYVWRMNQGKDLYFLLLNLLPFLITKKEKVYQGLLAMVEKMNKLEFTLKSSSNKEV